ncbi:hypothetical protein CRUP_006358 [Coryphaenoides rupestris]|nr:hypothetical protein CRUP_006358 [Coryphaenoides rupestris]
MQHGRGVALGDFNRDGKTDIVYGNWNGPHRLYIQTSNRKQRFKRIAQQLLMESLCSAERLANRWPLCRQQDGQLSSLLQRWRPETY